MHLDLCNKTHNIQDKILRDIPARISVMVISTPKHLHAGDDSEKTLCDYSFLQTLQNKKKSPIIYNLLSPNNQTTTMQRYIVYVSNHISSPKIIKLM